MAAALDDFDDVFAILREASALIAHVPRSALRRLIDAAAVRWHLEAGQTRQAEELIPRFPRAARRTRSCVPAWTWHAGRFDAVKARLRRASLATMRDRLTSELLLSSCRPRVR